MMELSQKQQKWVDSVWNKIAVKMELMTERLEGTIPYIATDGIYEDMAEKDRAWWTNGFWPGILWLMYVGTGKECYQEAAKKAEEQLDEVLNQYELLHHDVGFMWHLSSGVQYRLTHSKQSKSRNLYAASTLFSRYNMKGRYIRAWNGTDNGGWAIIDCMMNIPLLYWASEETGDNRFSYIAMSHADTTMEHHIRPDGSVKHIVEYDPVTGEYIREHGGQGYGAGSSWSRGQAWALYGFVLSYLHTGKQEYLDTAKRIAHYYISCVCDDYLPKADFRCPQKPVIYDSTSGAIAACGLLELAKAVPEEEKKVYFHAALKLLEALEANFCDWSGHRDGILQMGTASYHGEQGRHAALIYGDYFFVEAIYKLKEFGMLFW